MVMVPVWRSAQLEAGEKSILLLPRIPKLLTSNGADAALLRLKWVRFSLSTVLWAVAISEESHYDTIPVSTSSSANQALPQRHTLRRTIVPTHRLKYQNVDYGS